ncbi:exosortase P [Actinosynnema sp. NPDC020468]|uniref:exosortase P n=1 Tax=Actinosynnema sp. NPDC020468 TaxID=3154488 RepID=UPI0033CABCFE
MTPEPLLKRWCAGVFAALAVALVLAQTWYRTAEVRLAGVLVDAVTSTGVHVAARRQTVYFGLGGDTPFGLRMTPECTSAFLLVPLLLVAALMVGLRPGVTGRVAVALLAAAVAVVVVNQLRVLTLVGLIGWLGTDRGYYWGHTLFGSMVSVFGGAAALVLFVALATRAAR